MPVYLATIAGGALQEARPRRTLLVASAFVLGLSSVFVALGALASSLGAVLTQYRGAITISSGVLMLLFGAHSLGIFRLRRLDRDVRPGLMRVQHASTLVGAFLFGAAFALGWSPCIGPVLAAVLSYAAAHGNTPAQGALYLAVYAAGLALPLLALALGAGHATHWVRRMRGAIPKLERVTGLALLGVGVWTLSAAVLDRPAPKEQTCDIAGAGHSCALGEVRADVGEPIVLPAEGAQFLEFSAHDCPVCRRMRPVIEKLAATCSELDARIVRVDVNTSSGRALADRFHVHGTPTFVLLNEHGIEEIRLLGENTGEQLAAAVERAFGVSCST
jgi:cytochrome c-type biogenesis protein